MCGTVCVEENRLRTKINGFHNLAAALFNGSVLECLADAVEEHYANRFRILMNHECTDGCDTHKEVLVHHVTGFHVFEGCL